MAQVLKHQSCLCHESGFWIDPSERKSFSHLLISEVCSPSPPCILLRCISHHRLSAPCGPGEVATLCTVMSSASLGGPNLLVELVRIILNLTHVCLRKKRLLEGLELFTGKGKSVEFKLLPSLLRRRRWRRRWRWWRFLMGQILLEGAKKQPEHTVVQGSRHENQTALCYFHRLPSADHSLVVELNKIPACPRPPWPPWRCVACSSLQWVGSRPGKVVKAWGTHLTKKRQSTSL